MCHQFVLIQKQLNALHPCFPGLQLFAFLKAICLQLLSAYPSPSTGTGNGLCWSPAHTQGTLTRQGWLTASWQHPDWLFLRVCRVGTAAVEAPASPPHAPQCLPGGHLALLREPRGMAEPELQARSMPQTLLISSTRRSPWTSKQEEQNSNPFDKQMQFLIQQRSKPLLWISTALR